MSINFVLAAGVLYLQLCLIAFLVFGCINNCPLWYIVAGSFVLSMSNELWNF